jgi:hypothetical protein
MNRGDWREPSFRDDVDHKRFLTTLAEACRQTDWQVHAFCLMHNHFQMDCGGVEHGPSDARCQPTAKREGQE